jgi:antitoxin component of MazEF toxin-antitoxin module
MALRKTLTPIGGSLGVIIDKPILQSLDLDKHSVLQLSIENGAIVLRAEPRRAASSREELHRWARHLLLQLSNSVDAPDELTEEISRLAVAFRVLTREKKLGQGPSSSKHEALLAWTQKVVELLDHREAPAPPIFTRVVAGEILEELARAQGTFVEVTASRRFGGASSSVVAGVLWSLLARELVEVHPDSSSIRPALERLRQQGRVPQTLPSSLTDALINGVTLLRLTPAGGDYLHELRRRETTRDDL